MKEETKYVDLNICPEVLTLFYLSKITRIDLLTLTLLFEKIGTSLYYLFYMLAKRKINFPSEANLLKAIKFTDTVEALDNNYMNTLNKIPDKDKEIFKELISSIVDKRYIRVEVDTPVIVRNESSIIHESTQIPSLPIIKSELNSAIKKYIRKEKRRLEKINQVNQLFSDSPIRNNLIDKIYSIFIVKLTENDNKNDLKELINTLIDGYNK